MLSLSQINYSLFILCFFEGYNLLKLPALFINGIKIKVDSTFLKVFHLKSTRMVRKLNGTAAVQ